MIRKFYFLYSFSLVVRHTNTIHVREKITIRVLSESSTEELNVVVSKKFPNMKPEDKDKIHREIIELLNYDKLVIFKKHRIEFFNFVSRPEISYINQFHDFFHFLIQTKRFQLTIYELNDSKEFDLALLAALIRGNKDGTSSLASMKLAITWDRPNLADSLILPNSKFSVSVVFSLYYIPLRTI